LNLRKIEDTGSTRCHFVEIALCKRYWTVVRLRDDDDDDDVFVLTSVMDKGAMLENYKVIRRNNDGRS
jgi:hypothetical protein